MRYLGTFLADPPLDVPDEVVDYIADQLDIENTDPLETYTVRGMTCLGHAQEIQREYGIVDFAAKQHELGSNVETRA